MKTLWWSRRAITLHVALVVAVPLFLTLGAWQLHRALRGNLLSWAYTFEWPFFAGYATWMWWRLVHEETATAADLIPVVARRRDEALTINAEQDRAGVTSPAIPAGVADEPGDPRAGSGHGQRPIGSVPVPRSDYDPFDDAADPELAAYNRYLAGLHAERTQQ